LIVGLPVSTAGARATESVNDLVALSRPVAQSVGLQDRQVARIALLLAATLFAHEPAAFGEHGSAGLYDHGGPLAASMSTISPG
jgi:hypothetical protein